MNERSKMLLRWLIGASIGLSMGVVTLAQEDENSEPPPAAAEPGEETDLPRGSSDDVFIPTEEIPADEEVTFPVDI